MEQQRLNSGDAQNCPPPAGPSGISQQAEPHWNCVELQIATQWPKLAHAVPEGQQTVPQHGLSQHSFPQRPKEKVEQQRLNSGDAQNCPPPTGPCGLSQQAEPHLDCVGPQIDGAATVGVQLEMQARYSLAQLLGEESTKSDLFEKCLPRRQSSRSWPQVPRQSVWAAVNWKTHNDMARKISISMLRTRIGVGVKGGF